MLKDSLPPFLRGLGTTVVLIGALVGLAMAHHRVEVEQENLPQLTGGLRQPSKQSADTQALMVEIEELRSEVERESVATEVLASPSFEWMGFVGTAIIASSFFVEAYLRRPRR